MANIICWICKIEMSFKNYDGTRLLDEQGNKPCFECILEDQAIVPEDEVEQ